MIQFNQPIPWHWLAVGGLITTAGIIISYLRAKGSAKAGFRAFLVGIRLLSICLVVFFLLDPQRIEPIKRQQKSRLAVLFDTSASMAIADVGASRLDAARKWVTEHLVSAAPPGTEFSYFTFSGQLAAQPDSKLNSATGGVTSISSALEELLAFPTEVPPAGVVLCSDGIETVQKDPVETARQFGRRGIPIFALTCGTTNEPNDVVLENLEVRRAVPNESPTRVTAIVRSSGFNGRAVPVSIRRGDELLTAKAVTLNGGTQRVELDFTPRQKGFQFYEVSITPSQGEWLASNNRRQFGLEVIDPTLRVIYMEGTPQTSMSPIPEWKYLKDALESDPNIKVTTLYREAGMNGRPLDIIDRDPDSGKRIYPVGHPTKGFPRTLQDLLAYDVIIHSDIRKESFTSEQLLNMARLVEVHGGGFIMIGGNSAFGKGGYHRTVLDRLIPVAMEGAKDSESRPIRLQVPRNVWSHPVIAIGDDVEETKRIWGELFPTLYGLNRVDRAKPGATVLAEESGFAAGSGGEILLAVQEVGKGRTMAFTSDTTRTWGRDFETEWGERINVSRRLSESNCDSRYFRRFWVNAVRWLAAGKAGKTNQPVVLELSRIYAAPGDVVEARVRVRNDALQDVIGADVSLFASSGGKTNRLGEARFDANLHAYVAKVPVAEAGACLLMATASRQGARLGDDRQALFCEDSDRELGDIRARPGVMSAIARASGGKAFDGSSTVDLAISEVFGKLAAVTVEQRQTPIWDKPWWLAAVVGLLTAEWSLRRWRGMA